MSQDLAIKIGTAYTQRLLWKNSMGRHYHGVDEMRCTLCLARVCTGAPPSIPSQPPDHIPKLTSSGVAGLLARPCP